MPQPRSEDEYEERPRRKPQADDENDRPRKSRRNDERDREDTRPTDKKKGGFPLWILAVLLPLAFLLLLVCGGGIGLAVYFGSNSPATAKTPNREEFEKLARSAKNQQEVVEKLGKPTSTHPASTISGERWFYDGGRAIDPVTGNTDERVIVHFAKDDKNKVERVEFIPRLIRLR